MSEFTIHSKVKLIETGEPALIVDVGTGVGAGSFELKFQDGNLWWYQADQIELNTEPTETLRDKFAASALGGLMAINAQDKVDTGIIAAYAYRMADAMLKAREVKHD